MADVALLRSNQLPFLLLCPADAPPSIFLSAATLPWLCPCFHGDLAPAPTSDVPSPSRPAPPSPWFPPSSDQVSEFLDSKSEMDVDVDYNSLYSKQDFLQGEVLLSPDGTNLEYEQLLLITCKCMYFTVRSYMPSRVKQILPSFCKDMFCILDSLNFNSLIEDGSTMKLRIAKRCLIIFCALVTRHRKHTNNQMPHIVNCAIKISKQSIHLSGWRLVSPHFSSLLDSAIFLALALNEKDIEEWEEDTDEYMQKNLPSELDDISGWTEDLFTARKSAINLLGVIALSKGPPVASAASKRKKGDKNKGKSEMSSIGELLVIPFLSKFPIPSHGEDASSVAVQNYFGVLMAYGGLQDFLTEKKDLTITLIRNRILPLYSLDPCSPYLISTANWVIGQLAICLPEDMSSSIYQSLMKALTMEYVEDITCYPVCASASGAIAELIENSYVPPDWLILLQVNSYVPPDWLILLQVVLKRISTGDENESALLFKLLGTIVEGGQEKVLSHIPKIVSNIASTVMELLSPVPDPWPQVVVHLSSVWSIFWYFIMMTGGRNTGRVGVIKNREKYKRRVIKNREKHKGSFETIHVLLRAFCYV
ncbi:40S ribosomal protein S4 [Zea mays]|uniref:40S ribosomal protein S4 n=1 Tax=Zea mays TaxID=4577 RepID=A0A3L6F034_MAIZE|nr:40S ribosomal protein S4 [Zea mays]